MSDATLRRWLRAAAAYNFLWGSATILAPGLLFTLIHMPVPAYRALWQVVGMFVLVYAPGYWWASIDPIRHRQLLAIGLLGKILGPIGFAWAVMTGQLPIAFGLVILGNDVVWWPALLTAVRRGATAAGGWQRLAEGQ